MIHPFWDFVDSTLYSVLWLIGSLLVIPFAWRVTKDKQSKRKRIQLILAALPMLALLSLRLYFQKNILPELTRAKLEEGQQFLRMLNP